MFGEQNGLSKDKNHRLLKRAIHEHGWYNSSHVIFNVTFDNFEPGGRGQKLYGVN